MLLEQYGKFKKAELEESPFRCLLNTKIEINPHQINAFCAAIQALKTGGIVLADEVGLGKTIEAGLTIKYVLDSGAKRVLIALPATLRKQWEVELEEKFSLKTTILDRLTVESNLSFWKSCLENRDKVRIVITSYDYSSKLMQRFPNLKWDFIIIDEAHNLRNVFHGTKRAKRLYELSKGIPKILLTATPLQNSLSDLHGLISFIDPRIFGSEKVFNKRFIEGQDYPELKRELIPVLYRTLRRDVGKYMDFKKRECRTIDFALSPDEVELYMRVNNFLKRDVLYSIPNANKGLIVLVIRKLLASSSYALIETFEVLKNRLQKLYEGTKSANAQDGFALFWDFIEDEIDESAFEEIDDEDTLFQKQQIQAEMDEVDAIIETASRIQSNAKIKALKTAIHTAFEYQGKQNIPQKVVVFTESKRTQKYIAAELCKDGFEEDDILLFNGDFNDAMTKEIYRAWQVKNFGKTNYGRSVEYKHAIVDYFKEHSKVLIVTDAGSEGLNLQFCNTVINYDLPWNPQKIEQRIGRCHRYGQKYDVVAINLLNTGNEADRRVYEILSKKFELFDGIFGASDIAIGALESGTSFEKTILDIYQHCRTRAEFKKAFDRLDRHLDAKRNKKAVQLRSILMTDSDEAKGAALERTKNDIDRYLQQVDFWSQVAEPDVEGNLSYWKIDNWGEKTFGSHGTLFVGAFCKSNNEMLFPVLLLCDDRGRYIDFTEDDIVQALETVDDDDVRYFKPTNEEMDSYRNIYDTLVQEMLSKYQAASKPVMNYNKRKVENWADIQREQLNIQIAEMNAEIDELSAEATAAKDFLEKVDIRKKVDEKKKQLQKVQTAFHQKVASIQEEAEREIAEFNQQFDIQPILLVNVVLKF
ncbi:DISARM system SNF2-like helicase DrmD [Streptococcus sp. CCUG 49591]|uniref:DISARM system SNF2-like helicase DrmD n=1 Tax=unclassified Streptococcus TaxID=2608887 RepID=UPI001BAF717F|nr:DISARM system SNF2-like helicase DrmD [Streptococcus sp. CCUG 49591]MBR9645159.1 DISARM system SNF2-like helicase DrmD [Streptococcus sp. 11-4097]